MGAESGSEQRETPSNRRKLVAILYADMAGYSRLISHDDQGTLDRLRGLRRELIDPAIEEHAGRIVQTGGDSLLVVFDSIDGAVRCAVKMQAEMPLHDGDRAPNQSIRFRIGINIGDAIADGTDLHGDAVNVAARLQAECLPGGICVSRSVRDHVHGRLDLTFGELGVLKLKNIARPVEAFAVQLADGRAAQIARPSLPGHALQLDLQQLRIFFTVVKLGGISQAADRFGESLASIGGRLLQLEQSCGVVLLHHSDNGVTLTDAGRLAFEHAERVFSQADELQSVLRNLSSVRTGRLTVGGSLTAGEFFLPQVASRFRRSYPDIILSIVSDNSTAVLNMIRKADLDIGFIGTDAIPDDLDAVPCWHDEIVVIAAPDSPAGSQPMEVIDAQKFVMREEGSATRQHIEQYLRSRGLNVTTIMTVSSPEAVKRYVAAGIGWGFVSRHSIATELAAGQLGIVMIEGWNCRRTFYAVLRSGYRLSEAQASFVELAKALDL
jgi:DNA-binding transcriptional LysR family regulator/class 3 adenylate cyclase